MERIEPETPEQIIEQTENWGLQTIGYALNLRAYERGTLKHTPAFIDAMATETESITKELRETALSECSNPDELMEVMMLFIRNVFDWCAEHRKA